MGMRCNIRWLSGLFILQVAIANAQPAILSCALFNDTIGQYEIAEFTLDIAATFSNPYNRDEVMLAASFTSPSGIVLPAEGYYMKPYTLLAPDTLSPPGNAQWKVRFTPRETGRYYYFFTLTDVTGTVTTFTDTLYVIPSEEKGFLSFHNNRLCYDDNSLFIGIGENIGWVADYQYSWFDVWTDSLVANNCNFIRVWFSVYTFQFEWNTAGPVGVYTGRLDRAWWLDWFLEMTREKGIYVQLCLNEQQTLLPSGYPNWNYNPYNSDLGGPCDYPWEFFSDAEAKRLFKRKLRYLVSRYGAFANLLSWELFNEVDAVEGYATHQTAVVDWHNQMALYLKSIDIYGHPVSSSLAVHTELPNLWALPSIDYTQAHRYHNTTYLDYHLYQISHTLKTGFNKPTFNAEIGPSTSHLETYNLDPQGIHIHDVAWASLFSDAFATAMPWYWSHYIHTYNLYHQLNGPATFSRGMDIPNTMSPLLPETNTSSHSDLIVIPGFEQSFYRPTENYFQVGTNGILTPDEEELATMLYGYGFNVYRNPPHFMVNYTVPGMFTVNTGSIAFFSKLKISIDGITSLQITASANTSYTIPVPAGTHTIFCENIGNGYVSIESYNFKNYRSDMRCYALQNSNSAYGWVQHLDYNYLYIHENGIPSPVTEGTVKLGNFIPGYYEVTRFHGNTGLEVSRQIEIHPSGDFHLNFQNLQHDAAFSVMPLSSQIESGFLSSDTIVCPDQAVTFTDTTTGIYTYRKWIFPGGLPSVSYNPQINVYYSNPGTYDVFLIHVNAFLSDTLVKKKCIQVDPLPGLSSGISVPAPVCEGDNTVLLSAAPVPNASFYEWQIPDGCSGTSDSVSILLSVLSGFTSGTVSLRAHNGCGQGGWVYAPIQIAPAPIPLEEVFGESLVCRGTMAEYFSVTPDENVILYVWNTDDVQWSTSEPYTSIDFPIAGVTHLSVKAYDACGRYAEAEKTIQVKSPVVFPGEITGRQAVYQGECAIPYSVTTIPNATSYHWFIPEAYNSTTVSARTTGLSFASDASSAFISCSGSNVCGMGPASSFFIEVTPLPPGWDCPLTHAPHTFFLVDQIPVTLDGVLLTDGFSVGVFYDDNLSYRCGGAIPEAFFSQYEFYLHPDDPALSGKDGFFEGDSLYWMVYDPVTDYSYFARADYAFGPQTFSSEGFTVVTAIEASSQRSDVLPLAEGWSGISSYIQPDDSLVAAIFAPVEEELIIVKHFSGGVYWPPWANTLVYWSGSAGYKTAFQAPEVLPLSGRIITKRTLNLDVGWNEIPVLAATPVNVINLFEPLADTLVIAKESVGNGVYWPEAGVNTLESLLPGKAYMVYLEEPASITFPTDTLWPGGFCAPSQLPNAFIAPSSESHILVFKENSWKVLKKPAQIYAISTTGTEVGFVNAGAKGLYSLAVYGNNPSSGLPVAGDRFFLSFDGEMHCLYIPLSSDGSEIRWMAHGYSVVSDFQEIETSTGSSFLPEMTCTVSVRPNPVSEQAVFVYCLPGGVNHGELQIYSPDGAVVNSFSLTQREGQLVWDTRNVPSGVYYYQLETNGLTTSGKVMVIHPCTTFPAVLRE